MSIRSTSTYSAILLAAVMFISINVSFSQSSLMGSVEGEIWLDKNSNNIRDLGDDGIPDIRVELFLSSGILVQFQNSDSNGLYQFDNIPDGEYYINVQKKDGLQAVLQNVGNNAEDSDIGSNGISDFFIHDESAITTVDAGFESSLYVLSKNIIESCIGSVVNIELMPMSFGDNIQYAWSHDTQLTSNLASINVTQTQIYSATITDEWNMPVVKEILVKVREGVGEEFCSILDPFNEGESSSFNLNVTDSDPGPINVVEQVPSAFGGFRDITFELIEGSKTSSIDIDYSNQNFSISNGNGSRTKTDICYNGNANGQVLSIAQFDYFKFLEVLIDQGTVQTAIVMTDINGNTASYVELIESQGFNNVFDEEVYFENFQNINAIDLNQVDEICFELITMNAAIDFEVKFTSFCGENSCFPEASATQSICLGESTEIEGFVACTNNVIFDWDNGLGFSKSHTVSPNSNTTYTVTVYDQNGCSSTAQTNVIVNTPPESELVYANSSICEGQSLNIEVNHISGNAPYTYLWSTSENTREITVSPAISTNYEVTVFDANLCTDIHSLDLTVFNAPDISVVTSPSNCKSFNGTAEVSFVGGTPPFQVNWSNGDTGTSLTDLPPGNLEVVVTDANSCSFSQNVSIASLNCAEIGDFVWHDINVNGIQEVDEPVIENVRVILKDVNQMHLDTMYTDEFGNYLFTALDEGMYYVQFDTPVDFKPSIQNANTSDDLDSDMDPITGMSHKITIGQDEKDYSIDAGFYQLAKIGNYVWHDENINGQQDSNENGIEGISVSLYDCNDVQLSTTLTDAFGGYAFCDLEPGNYYVHFDTLAGFSPTLLDEVQDTLDSDYNPLSGNTECINLLSGEIDSTLDAGFYELGKIGDYVWNDINLNGIQDDNESPISDIQIFLMSCDSTKIDSIVTDSLGKYLFCDLEPGKYQLLFPAIPNFNFTPSIDTIDLAINSDVDSLGYTQCIDIEEGEKDTLVDAGYYEYASLGDFVWLDKNNNGEQEMGESGFEDVKVYLLNCMNEILDSTTTNDEGYYLFIELEPGEYKIQVERIGNYLVTKQDNVANDLDSDIDEINLMSECVDLASGENYRDLDAGFYSLSKLGDFVWFDKNGNGIQDVDEEGKSAVEVELIDCTTGESQITFTNSQGYYCFENLLPSNYQINFNLPTPWIFTDNNQGGNDEADSDPNANTGIVDCFELGVNEEILDIDAGVFTCSKIGDFIWNDFNENNLQDPNENGINGIKVNLYKLINGVWTLVDATVSSKKPNTSSDDGWWELCVNPGRYYLEFEQIDGLIPVVANVGNDDTIDSDLDGSFGPLTTDAFDVISGIEDLNFDGGFKLLTNNSGSFDASIESLNGMNLIKWNSDDENNAELYRLYKKNPNEAGFESLENVETKNEALNLYQRLDQETELNGLYEYRIEMIDDLDKILDQQMLSILVNHEFQLLLYPNPVSTELNLILRAAQNDEISIDIIDANGRKLRNTLSFIMGDEEMYDININVEAFSSGKYYLVYRNNDKILSEQFLIVH